MLHHVVYLGEYSMWVWEKYTFWCCVECSINIDFIKLTDSVIHVNHILIDSSASLTYQLLSRGAEMTNSKSEFVYFFFQL